MQESPDTVVFGATGFMGRWLVLHLLEQERAVAAVVRGPAKADELRRWLRGHGADTGRLAVVIGDLTAGADLGLDPADDERLAEVRDVFNIAAVYRFGMRRDEARAANVEGAVHVVRWAAARPGLRRLVHVSGYRVGSALPARYPLPEADAERLYRDGGAYEGSKAEGDAAVRAVAARLDVPLTVVNPSSVVGDSTTGEAGQYIGLAELVHDLWRGRLPVLPGNARTFVPVVAVDHLARFMAAISEHDPEPGGLHWVLDEDTPELPDLVRLLARHLGVRPPRALVPVGAVRRLPRALTGADPETLTFLTDDRYDTASADAVADAAGLRHPPVEDVLRRWADRLVADGFGANPAVLPGAFRDVAGSRTYVAGEGTAPRFVLLHGLPLDGESWQGLLTALDGTPALVPDLPGLGRSSPAAATSAEWLAELLAPVRTRPVIVAHSAAAAPALRYAAAHPDRVAALVLVSPFFLQQAAPRVLRTPVLAAPLLKRIPAGRLAASLLGAAPPDGARRSIASAAAQLRRPGVARRTARLLQDVGRPAERANLHALLETAAVPVHIAAGDRDPLIGDPGRAAVTTVPGAGHYPQLTHPDAIAALLQRPDLHSPDPGSARVRPGF
ncbi:alpha/beta fold hydrolase [Actinomadura fibrosa]|uniref:Alpha/beta fold hydrolase n=1 Tax=Actinomadura fibrosa TaxID=111802 RepID=A0ABW2XTD6_9ACTN|nr:alpha/beta fold hydrolase [Actinomadura fibrosa]